MAAESNPSVSSPAPARREQQGSASQGRAETRSAKTLTQTEHVRETADSIVVAFILAFVFRAFVIEAFVIPTGSMAATLYGRHGTMICHDCGWEFAYGLSDPSSQPRDRRAYASPDYGPEELATCPNCAHGSSIAQINDRKENSEAGDRILALKWPYDVGGDWLGPHRWDVTLFKDPSDTDLNDGVTNFIKRLVGLPNEVLEIIDGDIYVAPVDKLSPAVIKALDDARHAKYLRQMAPNNDSLEARNIEHRLRAIWPQVLEELSRSQQISRKAPLAQKTLWTVVYDHDFPPRTLDADQPFWGRLDDAAQGWDVGGRRLRFKPSGDGMEGIALRNRPVLDLSGYNLRINGEPCGVTDLRLRMVFTRLEGDGALLLKLPKRERSYWAEIRSDGELRLFVTDGALPGPNQQPMAAAKLSSVQANQAVVLDFQNVDYRVSLSVDGQERLAQPYSPDINGLRDLKADADLGEVQILARGMTLDLNHLVVERDVYYRSPRRNLGLVGPLSQLTSMVWGGTGNPILLRRGEYFMLGDNSEASGDSRLWHVIGQHLLNRGEACQLGTVPRDQLIGRAFFVYWPSGHRSDIIPFLDRIGLIPDVGRMRWIR